MQDAYQAKAIAMQHRPGDLILIPGTHRQLHEIDQLQGETNSTKVSSDFHTCPGTHASPLTSHTYSMIIINMQIQKTSKQEGAVGGKGFSWEIVKRGHWGI